MEILAIIPARGGSKGIPRKNIIPLNGKPLIAWSIEAAKKSRYINRVIVSTEDEEIKEVSLQYGATIPFLRPYHLALDKTPGMDPVIYTIEKLISDEGYRPDYVMLLQPTSPLRTSNQIDEAIEVFLNHQNEFDSLISVVELEHPVTWNKVMDSNHMMSDFMVVDKESNTRRQDIKTVYRLNGAIYLAKTNFLLELKDFETPKTYAYIMNRDTSVDIDTQDDLELAEFYLNKSKSVIK